MVNSTNGEISVTLLGTGVPVPVMERFGPSVLVQVDQENLLFDVGRGALQRLSQLQPPLLEVRKVFLTHLHSDHIVGLPDLWLTGWLTGRPDTPFHIWGPRGTREMMTHLDQAFQYDIRIRLYDDHLPPEGIVFVANDITEGLVYENNGIKVTAIEVDHYPIQPAFGYRIDYAGLTVVYSGDTRFSEHLIECAKGADVIIHEVVAADSIRKQSAKNLESVERVIAHHTTPEQAGEVFSRVKPRLAVYNHVLPVETNSEELIIPTRRTYSGPLEIGEDLMLISIGDTVIVKRHGSKTEIYH